ncbi:MAG: transcriptional repressor [Sulfurovum sp.]
MYFNKLEQCVKSQKINYSETREIIYRILVDTKECLNVGEIIEKLSNGYPKKISINTVYRTLKLFIECKIVMSINDNVNKAYYILDEDETLVFSICPDCNSIKKINLSTTFFIDPLVEELKGSKIITIHKKCLMC